MLPETILDQTIIVHAGGSLHGNVYLNSIDAIQYHYDNGYRLFEVDVNFTSDYTLVLSHDWYGDKFEKAMKNENKEFLIPSFEEFMQKKILGKYKPTSFKMLVDFMRLHDDIYVMIDINKRTYHMTQKLYQAIVDDSEKEANILQRFIVGGHTRDMIAAVKSIYNFENINLYLPNETHLKNRFGDIESFIAYCKTEGIKSFSTSISVFSEKRKELLLKSGLVSFVFNIDNELEKNKLLLAGIDFLGSDVLLETAIFDDKLVQLRKDSTNCMLDIAPLNSKLKIGIISINTHALNFACPLHSYAFSTTLTQLGYNNVIIHYQPKHVVPMSTNYHKFSSIKKERYEKFQAFINKYYRFTENQYTEQSLDLYDSIEGINCFIAATDVIWAYRKEHGFDKGFFCACRAMKDSYKIAYSVSRNQKKYNEIAEKEFLQNISRIHDISTREKSLADHISSVSDIRPDVVLDPVFLQNKEFYESLLIAPPRKEGYILVYLIKQSADKLVSLAAKFAEANNLELIELSEFSYHKEQTSYTRHSVIYNIGVEEWLGYIKNAEYIFTNSFHGVSLSIILERQFFYADRNGDKVDHIIEKFGLQWRNTKKSFNQETAELLADDIVYTSVNIILEALVQKSMSFLINSLKKAELSLGGNVMDTEIEQPDFIMQNTERNDY